MKKHSMALACSIVAIIFGALGFFGGMKYAEFQRQQARGNGNRLFQTGANGQSQGQGRMYGRPITGEIISIDANSMTIKTQDQGSRIVILSGTTTYSKTGDATKADLAIGTRVGVFGTDNTDKSMTAQNVQINPQFQARTTPTPSK